jgi:hypothetical protein
VITAYRGSAAATGRGLGSRRIPGSLLGIDVGLGFHHLVLFPDVKSQESAAKLITAYLHQTTKRLTQLQNQVDCSGS